MQTNSEQSSETGYGLVMTPGSIVTYFRKSQLVDPGWSKFDFDPKLVFFLFFQAKQDLRTSPQQVDTLTNQNSGFILIIFGGKYKREERESGISFSSFGLLFLLCFRQKSIFSFGIGTSLSRLEEMFRIS